MPRVMVDDRRTGLLVGTDHVAQLFRVKPCGECSRVYQITEQHRELASLAVSRSSVQGRGSRVRRGYLLLLRFPDSPILRFLSSFRTCPDQHLAVFVYRDAFGIDQIRFEIFYILVIEGEPALKHAVSHPPLALEELNDLR